MLREMERRKEAERQLEGFDIDCDCDYSLVNCAKAAGCDGSGGGACGAGIDYILFNVIREIFKLLYNFWLCECGEGGCGRVGGSWFFVTIFILQFKF